MCRFCASRTGVTGSTGVKGHGSCCGRVEKEPLSALDAPFLSLSLSFFFFVYPNRLTPLTLKRFHSNIVGNFQTGRYSLVESSDYWLRAVTTG